MAHMADRIVDDLTDEEYKDYVNHPENWEEVTDNTYDYYRELTGVNDDE